ncbi:hypothetical protein [Moraxella caviae]|nr:hypothetical protein [Moraxella caviae]
MKFTVKMACHKMRAFGVLAILPSMAWVQAAFGQEIEQGIEQEILSQEVVSQEISNQETAHQKTASQETVNPKTTNQPTTNQTTAIPDHYRGAADDGWVDHRRIGVKNWLNGTAAKIDDWFGEPDANKPATASLRFMVDSRYNRYDGESVKPRIRGRLRLPTLENRLSVMIGDDDLDDESQNLGDRTESMSETPKDAPRFDRRQARKDNASLALRWSRARESLGVETDVDLGVRSTSDVYLRLRAERHWRLSQDVSTHFEQIYRYGIKSEHYLRTNFSVSQARTPWFGTDSRQIVNHSHLEYTHQDSENLHWGNSLYQHHNFGGALGDRTLSYGLHASGDIENGSPSLNTYGPYAVYRQPVWRRWLFAQGELSYYNQKTLDRDHHLGAFVRLEAIF